MQMPLFQFVVVIIVITICIEINGKKNLVKWIFSKKNFFLHEGYTMQTLK